MTQTTAPPTYVTDIGKYGNYTSSYHQTTYTPDTGLHEGFTNMKADHIRVLNNLESENVAELIHQQIEQRLKNIHPIFTSRLEKDREIFASFQQAKIFQVFELMTKTMLLFMPNRISADVTADASIILQGHYGSLHIYWETYLSEEESELHSTLNIYSDKQLKFTKGDDLDNIQQIFLHIMAQSIKKATHL